MITYHDIRHNEEVRALIEAGNEALGVLGYTDHGYAHAGLTAKVAGDLLETLGYDERTCELARIAGFMHDIGNAVNRTDHALSGAALAFPILRSLGMDAGETAAVITAIGNHDEKTANAVTPLSAALILADKSDVRRSRVRISLEAKNFDIHDRVNYAVEESSLTVQKEEGLITLALRIDTSITAVMDYFEIFLSRMTLCRAAASFLGLDFELVINETRML
ncbi:HD domain-containing protein [Anaeromassilibacillus sp. SJQ-5]